MAINKAKVSNGHKLAMTAAFGTAAAATFVTTNTIRTQAQNLHNSDDSSSSGSASKKASSKTSDLQSKAANNDSKADSNSTNLDSLLNSVVADTSKNNNTDKLISSLANDNKSASSSTDSAMKSLDKDNLLDKLSSSQAGSDVHLSSTASSQSVQSSADKGTTTTVPSTMPSHVTPSSTAPTNNNNNTNVQPSSVAPSHVAPSSVAPSSVAPSSVAPSSSTPSTAPSSAAPSSVATTNYAIEFYEGTRLVGTSSTDIPDDKLNGQDDLSGYIKDKVPTGYLADTTQGGMQFDQANKKFVVRVVQKPHGVVIDSLPAQTNTPSSGTTVTPSSSDNSGSATTSSSTDSSAASGSNASSSATPSSSTAAETPAGTNPLSENKLVIHFKVTDGSSQDIVKEVDFDRNDAQKNSDLVSGYADAVMPQGYTYASSYASIQNGTLTLEIKKLGTFQGVFVNGVQVSGSGMSSSVTSSTTDTSSDSNKPNTSGAPTNTFSSSTDSSSSSSASNSDNSAVLPDLVNGSAARINADGTITSNFNLQVTDDSGKVAATFTSLLTLDKQTLNDVLSGNVTQNDTSALSKAIVSATKNFDLVDSSLVNGQLVWSKNNSLPIVSKNSAGQTQLLIGPRVVVM